MKNLQVRRGAKPRDYPKTYNEWINQVIINVKYPKGIQGTRGSTNKTA